jgi:hypothetical protein
MDGAWYDSRLTITLQAADRNATTLTLLHERLDDLATAMPEAAKMVRVGWELVLEKLALGSRTMSRFETPGARWITRQRTQKRMLSG